MRSILLLITFLALSGVALSSPYGRENALLEDVFSVATQDDGDGGDRADMEAFDALINSFSSIQEEDGDGDNARSQGFVSKIRKFVRVLKAVGNLAYRHFPNNKYVKKYSKYLRCLPNVQEELERVTTQENDEKEFKKLLSNLEAQAESEEDTAKVEFLKKLWRKAKRFGKRVFKGIKIVKKYLKCIKRSVEVQSEDERKAVEQEALQVLQRAITARLVRL